MLIKIFVLGPIENNTFVVTCSKSKKSFVIDPSFGAFEKIKNFLEDKSYTLDKILLTHSHLDHIADVKHLKDTFSSPVYIHKLEAKTLQKPEPLSFFSIKAEGVKPDVVFEDNDKIEVGDIEIKVIHTPGHTPGGTCFYIEKEKTLFSGDTLFKGSFGRVDFSYSNPKDMIKSLKKLSKLPKETKVYPGHGSQTTIKQESWMENVEQFI
ncbi:MAG: putative metallo-hydrolase [Candidatus Anoxychlamydiales bacterium]|nr:putative metallo-hydrolase [Candidatus Anoxychlamydiales bacterium]NGX40197.1 putative metallo-hydrolase [Candidatus Anoxychlamydiales bacterium]HEU64247.1 MBL fold metallo-hydrolase [Chlamydiota bacterium]